MHLSRVATLDTHLLLRLSMGNTSKSPLNNEGRYSVLDYATSIFDRCFSENRKYIGDATVRDPNFP